MITYGATLDVPAHTLTVVTRWIAAHRRARGIRPWQRAATARTQALLALAWFKDATRVHLLARDACISLAAAYRYLHEAIDVIADQAPDLHDVLATARTEQWPFVALDGTIVPIAQLHGPRNPTGYPCGSRRPVPVPPTTSPQPAGSSYRSSTRGRRRTTDPDRQGLSGRRHRNPAPAASHKGRSRRRPGPRQDPHLATRHGRLNRPGSGGGSRSSMNTATCSGGRAPPEEMRRSPQNLVRSRHR
ncbi:hypothetical protein NKG05_00970 [Oerskovia sp. M15]